MLVPRGSNNFSLFNDFFKEDLFFRNQFNLMKTDIIEKKDSYIVKLDLPGCGKENINLSLNNGYLEISVKVIKQQNSDEEIYLKQERFYGDCSRSFYIGDHITQKDVVAEFKNGVLNIVVPKKEMNKESEEARRIEIK